jgi:riboflavin kinase, archaea type
MDEMLILLLGKGANKRPVRITTTDIGAEAGMSQQNASRRLTELEAAGYVERSDSGISLTAKAIGELSSLHRTLHAAFSGKSIEIRGRIVKGLGEGGYYLSLGGYRKQVIEKLGFDPYPGTLNVRVDKRDLPARQQLRRMEPIVIQGFRDKERTYGDLFAYRCRLEGMECAIIIPLRTHHGADIIEIICAQDIKGSAGKKDGDAVKVTV